MNRFRIFALILIGLYCTCILHPVPKSQASADLKHQTVGFGPLYGDLVYPSSMTMVDGEAIILDQQGLHVFDMEDQKFSRFLPVSFSIENPFGSDSPKILQDYNHPLDYWKRLFSRFPRSLQYFLPPKWHTDGYMPMFSYGYVRSLQHDSRGLLYLLDYQRIIVLDPAQEKTVRYLDLNKLFPGHENMIFNAIFTLSEDKIYLFANYRKNNQLLYTIYELTLEGQLLQSIPLPSEWFRRNFVSHLVYLPDIQAFCIARRRFFLEADSSNLIFVDLEGNLLKTTLNIDTLRYPLAAFQKDGNLLIANQSTLIHTQYHLDEAHQLHLTPLFKEELEIPGSIARIALHGDYIGLIHVNFSMNYDEEKYVNQVLIKKDRSMVSLGSKPDRQEQFYGSFAFCANEDGELIVSNTARREFGIFSSYGEYISSIPYPHSIESLEIFDDVVYYHGKLYVTFNNVIHQYDFSEQIWEPLGHVLQNTYHRIVVHDDLLYISNARSILYPSRPQLYLINNDGTSETLWFEKPPGLSEDHFPLLLDFAIAEDYVIFLDSEYHCLYFYNLYTQEYLSTMHLPQENNFYTSMSLFPDGTFLFTDVVQSCLWHIDTQGEIIKKIGQKGMIDAPNTEEAYQETSDDFYVPIRAKLIDGIIYISDLFNCRYHMIPIEDMREMGS